MFILSMTTSKNTHSFSPSITSTANEPGYALITITQPLLTEAEQPEFQEGWEVELLPRCKKIEPNPGWELIDSQIVEDHTGHADYISSVSSRIIKHQ